MFLDQKLPQKQLFHLMYQQHKQQDKQILKAGLVCVGPVDNTDYTFSIPEDVTVNINNNVASFVDLEVSPRAYTSLKSLR